MSHTEIELYSCYGCGRIFERRDFENIRACHCGCCHMRLARPNWWNVLRFFLGHKKMIWVWVKENVFGRH